MGKNSNINISPIEKNPELKSAILKASPWLVETLNDQAKRKKLATLFNADRLKKEQEQNLYKLYSGLSSDGGWGWFKGMNKNPFISAYILNGFAKLKDLDVDNFKDNSKIEDMIGKTINWLDTEIANYHKNKQTRHFRYLSKNTIIYYLYTRACFNNIDFSDDGKEIYDYYINKYKSDWYDLSHYNKGILALVLSKNGLNKDAKEIVESLKEFAIYDKDKGMFWKKAGLFNHWSQTQISTHTLMVKVFDEVANDKESVYQLNKWLLLNKQKNSWSNTIATAEACYAILSTNNNELNESKIPDIKIADNIISNIEELGNEHKNSKNLENAIGYIKKTWSKNEIEPALSEVKIKNNNEIPSWGALYWQYFENLDKIKTSSSSLKIKKNLFVERVREKVRVIVPISDEKIKIGDKIIVRLEISADDDMEFIHLKDMRASSLEPGNVSSGSKYQHGLSYYQTQSDATVDFFFDYLPKGTYVFEYPLHVTHSGVYSNGIATIQSMYAPEFSSQSKSIRINIKDDN